MNAHHFNSDLPTLCDALGVRPATVRKSFDTALAAAEDAFFSVPIRALRFDPRDGEDAGKPDEAVTQAIQADRLRVMTLVKLRLQACASQTTSGEGSVQPVEAAAGHPAGAETLLGEFKRAHDLFENRLSEVTCALSRGDLSAATFPRVGSEARVELSARRAELQWVLEMLPKPNRA